MIFYDLDTSQKGHEGLDALTFRNLGECGEYFKLYSLMPDQNGNSWEKYYPIFENDGIRTVSLLEGELSYNDCLEKEIPSCVYYAIQDDKIISLNSKFKGKTYFSPVISCASAIFFHLDYMVASGSPYITIWISGFNNNDENFIFHKNDIVSNWIKNKANYSAGTSYSNAFLTTHPNYSSGSVTGVQIMCTIEKSNIDAYATHTSTAIISDKLEFYFDGKLFLEVLNAREQLKTNIKYRNPSYGLKDGKRYGTYTISDFGVGCDRTLDHGTPEQTFGVLIQAARAEEGRRKWTPDYEPEPPKPEEKEYRIFLGKEHPYNLILDNNSTPKAYYEKEQIWIEEK